MRSVFFHHFPTRSLDYEACQVTAAGNSYLVARWFFFVARRARTLREATLEFGRRMMWLADNAKADGRLQWKIITNVHGMQHIPDQASVVNPRIHNNYCEEGMVSKLANKNKSAANGPQDVARIQYTVLSKYAIGLLLRYEGCA